jgi:hypothetical protein
VPIARAGTHGKNHETARVRGFLNIALVPKGGLEPPRVTSHAPQTCASTSSATSALLVCRELICYLPGAGGAPVFPALAGEAAGVDPAGVPLLSVAPVFVPASCPGAAGEAAGDAAGEPPGDGDG